MTIAMKKIGAVLDSRPAGREALLAMNPDIPPSGEETVTLDFEGVEVLTPSFADEFITPLLERFPERVTIENARENAEVMDVLSFLMESWTAPPKIA